MLVDAGLSLSGGAAQELQVADAARLAESLGFDGVGFGEIRADPMLQATLALAATQRIRVATNVLIAFPRSPMVVAYATRNLLDFSGGRFTLGIGTQVRGHITRRFDAAWDSPGPRLREYVQSLHAIWDCWQRGAQELDFRGRFYQFTLMTPEFNLGPSPHVPRLTVAAVNSFNLTTAATLCDGVTLHSLLTPAYLREVTLPTIERAATAAGRSLDGFEVAGSNFLVWGPTPEAVAASREQVRRRIAFYSSTRAYAPVLEHHGLRELGPALRQLIAQKRWEELVTLVSDDVLDLFCISGVYEETADKIADRLAGLVDRIRLGLAAKRSESDRARIKRALEELHALPGRTSAVRTRRELPA
jgi:probable F420-dependent oxidoreductase